MCCVLHCKRLLSCILLPGKTDNSLIVVCNYQTSDYKNFGQIQANFTVKEPSDGSWQEMSETFKSVYSCMKPLGPIGQETETFSPDDCTFGATE